LGIKFTKFKKPTSENIEENNALLWAKQIFKTKPNQDVSADFKNKIKTVFHHLTKDELIEKLLANQMLQNKVEKEKLIKAPRKSN
jgi:ATP-dependent RNA helicase DeaD